MSFEKMAGRIIKLRKEAKLSQKSLAEEIGVSRSTISSWENGTVEPTAIEMKRLCKCFNTTPSYIFGQCDKKTFIEIPDFVKLDLSDLNQEGKTVLLEFFLFLKEKKRYEK